MFLLNINAIVQHFEKGLQKTLICQKVRKSEQSQIICEK